MSSAKGKPAFTQDGGRYPPAVVEHLRGQPRQCGPGIVDGSHIGNEIQLESRPAQLGVKVVVFTPPQRLVEESYLKEYSAIVKWNSQGVFGASLRIKTVTGASHAKSAGLSQSNRLGPAALLSGHG